ncbi:MAG: hypothetical protein WD048_02840 [Chitinophagales bacterium]
MKTKDINRNISLTFDFIREVVKDPSQIHSIPDNSTIEFIEKGFPIPETNKKTQPDKYFRVEHRFKNISDKKLSA